VRHQLRPRLRNVLTWSPLITGIAIANIWALSVSNVGRAEILTEKEAANALGAFTVCGANGGVGCTNNNGQACGTTGCVTNLNSICRLGSSGNYCYKLGTPASQINDCSLPADGGNCCAMCASGCSNYLWGTPAIIRGGKSCTPGGVGDVCSNPQSCGTPLCTTHACG
jgi:hypothetical protein